MELVYVRCFVGPSATSSAVGTWIISILPEATSSRIEW